MASSEQHAESRLVPWVDHRDGREYLCDFEFAVVDGRAEVVAFRLYSRGYEMPVTATLLKHVPFARLAAEQRTGHAKLQPATAEMFGPRKPGRRLDDEVLIEVADVYRQALAHGLAPNVEIARTFGISYSTATKRTALARQRGFLPPVNEGTDDGTPA